MASFRSWKKELDRKREEDKILTSLQNTERTLARRRDEYAEKAKNALKEGNRSQYMAYVALLKNAIFNLAQAQDMTANFIIARDLREMQSISQRFVRAIDSVMKEVYKTSQSINVAASQKIFLKALERQNYTAKELQQLLSSNNVAFSSSVTALSDISDDEVRTILEGEIKKDEKDFEDTLKKLEAEFSVQPQAAEIPAQREMEVQPAPAPAPEPVRPAPTPAPTPMPAPEPPKTQSPNPEELKAPAPRPAPPEEPKSFDVDHIAFRPQYLRDYIGQPNAVATLSDPIKKARLTGRPLPHILICGSYGQGKTTLAKIIANEMKGSFITVSAAIKHREMLQTIRNLKPNDILFIDEIHKLATDVIETLLYPAMEDFEVHVTETMDGRTQTKTLKVAPFTLIGATTETGKLLKPFYSKFPINVTLIDYDLETIAAIVKNSFRVTNIAISDELAHDVARRSRLSPRMANAYVNGIGASAIVREAERRALPDGSLRDEKTVRALNIRITQADVEDYFKRIGVDELGLREEERKILRIVIEMYHGGPVGQENLAKALNMAVNRIDQEYEPYLIKLGFLNVRPQGRYVTEAGYRYLGYEEEPASPAPEEGPADASPEGPADIFPSEDEILLHGNGAQDAAKTKDVPPMSEDNGLDSQEEPAVTACRIGAVGPNTNGWLALFAGEGAPCERSLDELFPDGEGEVFAATGFVLQVENGRQIVCPSLAGRDFLKALFESGAIVDAKAAAFTVSSQRAAGKQQPYPDFVLKLYDGRIAAVAVMPLSSMGYHVAISRYVDLMRYCGERGFLYAQVAAGDTPQGYLSAEQLKEEPVNLQLHAFIRARIEESGFCPSGELNSYGYSVKELMTILLTDRTLKNVDRTGTNPQIMSADE